MNDEKRKKYWEPAVRKYCCLQLMKASPRKQIERSSRIKVSTQAQVCSNLTKYGLNRFNEFFGVLGVEARCPSMRSISTVLRQITGKEKGSSSCAMAKLQMLQVASVRRRQGNRSRRSEYLPIVRLRIQWSKQVPDSGLTRVYQDLPDISIVCKNFPSSRPLKNRDWVIMRRHDVSSSGPMLIGQHCNIVILQHPWKPSDSALTPPS